MAPKDQSRSKSITTKSQKREDVRVVKKIADSTPKEFESKDASEEKVGDADEKVDDDGIDDDEGRHHDELTFKSLGVVEPLCMASEKLGWKVASEYRHKFSRMPWKARISSGLPRLDRERPEPSAYRYYKSCSPIPYEGLFMPSSWPRPESWPFKFTEVVEGLGIAMGVNSVCIVGGVDIATQALPLLVIRILL
jgi:hypothetical protein